MQGPRFCTTASAALRTETLDDHLGISLQLSKQIYQPCVSSFVAACRTKGDGTQALQMQANLCSIVCKHRACTCKHALSQSILHTYGDVALQATCHFLCCLNCPEERTTVYLAYVFALHTRASVRKYHNTVQRPQAAAQHLQPEAQLVCLLNALLREGRVISNLNANQLFSNICQSKQLSTRTHLCLSQPMLVCQVRSFTMPGNEDFSAGC